MKKLKELFEISRNERIGLICVIVLLIVILLFSFFSSNEENTNINIEQLAPEMHNNIDSVKIDTIKLTKRRKSKNNKQEKENIPILTVSSMEKTETFK